MAQFELWVEGTDLWGHQCVKARKVDVIDGIDFNQAVDNYVATLPTRQAVCWEYDELDHVWKWTGRRAFDNEKDARHIYG